MRALFRVLLVSPGLTGDSGNTPSTCPNLVKHEVCKLKNCPEDPSPVEIMGEFVKNDNVKRLEEYPNSILFRSKMETRWQYAEK